MTFTALLHGARCSDRLGKHAISEDGSPGIYPFIANKRYTARPLAAEGRCRSNRQGDSELRLGMQFP